MRAVQATVRLLAGLPSACSGCAASPGPGVSHVEFILPALKTMLAGEGSTFVADEVDELVMCSTCLRTAALRLGLRQDPRADVELQRLAAARDRTRSLVDDALQEQNMLRERISMLEGPR